MADSEPIIWMRPEVTGRGKPPGHSREQIAKAAVAIADVEGIDAVSMRRVAAEIGAGTMSLYRYVRNKDELYALMVDAVGPDIPPRLPYDDWRKALRDFGRGTRDLVLEHPWVPVLQAGVPAPSPKMFRGLESMLGAVDGLGLPIDEMLEIVMTVMTFAMGAAQDELAATNAILRSGLDKVQWQRRQGAYLQSLIDSGQYPYLRRVVADAAIPHLDQDTIFERALDRLITGIAATIGQTTGGDPPSVTTAAGRRRPGTGARSS